MCSSIQVYYFCLFFTQTKCNVITVMCKSPPLTEKRLIVLCHTCGQVGQKSNYTYWLLWKKLAGEFWDWVPSHEYLPPNRRPPHPFGAGGVKGWCIGVGGCFFYPNIYFFLSPGHSSIHLNILKQRLPHNYQVHLLNLSIHPSIPHSTTLLLCALTLSDAHPPSPVH